jgi:hypothetical protein
VDALFLIWLLILSLSLYEAVKQIEYLQKEIKELKEIKPNEE